MKFSSGKKMKDLNIKTYNRKIKNYLIQFSWTLPLGLEISTVSLMIPYFDWP